MIIKLKQIDGTEKNYQSPFISALTYRKYMELKVNQKVDYLSEDPTYKQLDELVSLVVDAFKNQFTIDEFYAGQSTADFRETLIRFILETEGVPLNDMTEEEMAEMEKEMDADATPFDDGRES